METMSALSMSKSQCRATYRKHDNQPYDKIVIGAIIFNKRSSEPRTVLLLKRAAHEKYCPNIFHIPGGNVEATDTTIRDAVIREVLEENGLQVVEIAAAVKPFAYSMEKIVMDEETGEEEMARRTTLQLNFVCEVKGFDFKVNAEEHSEGRFVARGEVAKRNVTEQMRAVVEEGFLVMDRKPTEMAIDYS